MPRPIAIVGAPSSIGIRPYDDGEARHLDRAPGVLRGRNLIARLGAIDFGDVMPPPYRDFARPDRRARNEQQVVAYSRALAGRVDAAMRGGHFAVVLGGDCSIVLGCLLGATNRVDSPVGLVYVDAHADFATPQESKTGSVSGMSLSLASGRGDSPLASLGGPTPLAGVGRIALIGRRDRRRNGNSALRRSSILDLSSAECASQGPRELAAAALDRVASPGVGGFWIHLDVDVLNPAVMAAVDSPDGELMPAELVALLMPIVRHPLALGLDVSIYDPALDADRSCARLLVNLLSSLLASGTSPST